MPWISAAWAVFRKDLRLEVRTRYALNALAMFVASAVALVLFALGSAEVPARVQSALLWIVVLFAAAIGLGRTFVLEEDAKTRTLLRLHVPGSAVYAGKLLFNLVLIVGLEAAATLAFALALGLSVEAPMLLLLTLALAALGLAGATTLLSAIIARAARSGALLAVLAFPMLIPLLLSVVRVTNRVLAPPPVDLWAASSGDLLALTGYAGVVITASVLLFDIVWND